MLNETCHVQLFNYFQASLHPFSPCNSRRKIPGKGLYVFKKHGDSYEGLGKIGGRILGPVAGVNVDALWWFMDLGLPDLGLPDYDGLWIYYMVYGSLYLL